MWMIPEDGLKKNIVEADSDMKGHQKKVVIVKWHPSADFTLASSSADGTVKIWDIQNENATMSYDIKDIPWATEWNGDGSMIAAITKAKKMHILDPRA